MEKLPKVVESEIKLLSNEELKQMYFDIEKIKFSLFMELLDRKLVDPKRMFENGESEFLVK